MPVSTSMVPELFTETLLNVVMPVVPIFLKVPELVKAKTPPDVDSTSSLCASHKPLLLKMAPVPPWMVPADQTTVPALFRIEPAKLRVIVLVKFRVPLVAMLSVEPLPRVPPVQLMTPVTESEPLRANVPDPKFRPPTVVGVVTETVAELVRMAVSAAPGTEFGDQLAGLLQLPEAVFVQAIVAAWDRVMIPAAIASRQSDVTCLNRAGMKDEKERQFEYSIFITTIGRRR